MNNKLIALCVTMITFCVGTSTFALTPLEAQKQIFDAYTTNITIPTAYPYQGENSQITIHVKSDTTSVNMNIDMQSVTDTIKEKSSGVMVLKGIIKNAEFSGEEISVSGSLAMRVDTGAVYIKLVDVKLQYAGVDKEVKGNMDMANMFVSTIVGKWYKLDLQKLLEKNTDGVANISFGEKTMNIQKQFDTLQNIVKNNPLFTIGNQEKPHVYTLTFNADTIKKLFQTLQVEYSQSIADIVKGAYGRITTTNNPEINMGIPYSEGKVGVTINTQKATLRDLPKGGDESKMIIAPRPMGYGITLQVGNYFDDGLLLNASLYMYKNGKNMVKMNMRSNSMFMNMIVNSRVYDIGTASIDMPTDSVDLVDMITSIGSGAML